jgi:hypothetical protein
MSVVEWIKHVIKSVAEWVAEWIKHVIMSVAEWGSRMG